MSHSLVERKSYSRPHWQHAALGRCDTQHDDGGSPLRSSDVSHCRLNREHVHKDGFDLRELRRSGVHFAVAMEARRRKSRPFRVCRNLPRVRCLSVSQSFKTPVSQRIRAKRWRRDCSYCSAARAKTARMNLSRNVLTSAASDVARALVRVGDWVRVGEALPACRGDFAKLAKSLSTVLRAASFVLTLHLRPAFQARCRRRRALEV
jgi:hypothetical protein